MPGESVWFIIVAVVLGSVVLPAQILTLMHLFRRVKDGQGSLVWIILIFLLGLLGIVIYFIMPISRRPRIREEAFDFLSGEEKGK